jgi:hypothetical protein
MALTVKEGTTQETMDRIPKAGFPVNYANIMRVTIDCHSNFSADVRRYYSESEREENEYETPGLIGIGAQIPDEVRKDVMAKVYPYLQLEINSLYLNGERQKELEALPDAKTDEEKAENETMRIEINSRYDEEILKVKTDLGL